MITNTSSCEQVRCSIYDSGKEMTISLLVLGGFPHYSSARDFRGIHFSSTIGLSFGSKNSTDDVQGALFCYGCIFCLFCQCASIPTMRALVVASFAGNKVFMKLLLDQGFNISFENFAVIHTMALTTVLPTVLIHICPHWCAFLSHCRRWRLILLFHLV